MMERTRVSRLRRLMLVLAAYTAVVLGAPFEHHDLACHLKTPQHCSSCVASPVSAGAAPRISLPTTALADAGQTIAVRNDAAPSEPASPVQGRSPPAFA